MGKFCNFFYSLFVFFFFFEDTKALNKTPNAADATAANPTCRRRLLVDALRFTASRSLARRFASSRSSCSRLNASSVLKRGCSGLREARLLSSLFFLIARGMLSPPSEGVASRAFTLPARKACWVGWFAMPCASSGIRGLMNEGGSCGKPEPVILMCARILSEASICERVCL